MQMTAFTDEERNQLLLFDLQPDSSGQKNKNCGRSPHHAVLSE
jgi:hypothetical protein